MIKKLKIKNFQGHEESTLEFGPGINTITGENDSGKTSIFRSIVWVKDNRPLGTSFIRKNQDGEAQVNLETDETSVSRIRGEKTNEYRIAGIEDPFDSFGANPPSDVLEVLNLEDVNIQSQLDQPFLVLSSPGQIAQHIRSISGSAILDKAVSSFKEKISSKNSELKSEKKRLTEIEESLKRFQEIDIDKIENLIQSMEQIQEENLEVSRIVSTLTPLVLELEELERTQVTLPEKVDEIVESASDLCQKNLESSSSLQELESLVNELSEIEESSISGILLADMESRVLQSSNLMEQIPKICKETEDLESLIQELLHLNKNIPKLPEEVDSIISKIDPQISQYNNTEERIRSVVDRVSELKDIEENLKSVEDSEKVKQEELLVLLDKIEVCPLCERGDLSEGEKKKVLENYK